MRRHLLQGEAGRCNALSDDAVGGLAALGKSCSAPHHHGVCRDVYAPLRSVRLNFGLQRALSLLIWLLFELQKQQAPHGFSLKSAHPRIHHPVTQAFCVVDAI